MKVKLEKIKIKMKDIPVYEHLELCLKCTYAQRLEWLEEVNQFVRELEKDKNYLRKSRKQI